METLIIIPENERQLSLLKSLVFEMKIRYKNEKPSVEKFYDELNAKIVQARKEKDNGELINIDSNTFWVSA